MKRLQKRIAALCVLFALCVSSFSVYASGDMVHVYRDDGTMKAVSAAEEASYLQAGWQTQFPYTGQEFWLTADYFYYHTTDLYRTPTKNLVSRPQTFTKIQIIGYDETNLTRADGGEVTINSVLFEVAGAKYKMPMGDLLRGYSIGSSEKQIYWSNPKEMYGISDESWNLLQSGTPWIGMPKFEFYLLYGQPDYMETYTEDWGVIDRLVYHDAQYNEYSVFFRNDGLYDYYVY